MLNKFKKALTGSWAILKHEGIKRLLSRATSYILWNSVRYYSYYVSEVRLDDTPEDERQYLPKIKDYDVRLISTNKEADALAAEGFSFGAYEWSLRSPLDKGVHSFCVFIDKELAHINCVADNPGGKAALDPHPYHVDFENGEVMGGRAMTAPKYRRLGLRAYTGYLIRKLSREKGFKRSIGAIMVNNYPALANAAKNPNNLIRGKYRFIKIFGFEYCRELKMEPFSLHDVLLRKNQ